MASTSTALPSVPVESFGTALLNVRRLTGSGLTHQSKPAQLLTAIEAAISSSLPSSTLPHSPTAYFTALLQCLEKACAEEVGGEDEEMAETENMGQGALIPATLYLLAIVVPETSTQVVLSKTSPLLECLLPLYQTALDHPPALRSLLQITTTLLVAAPPSLLNSSPLLKKAWNYLLEINVDPRPKVRHLAQEGVRKVLCTPIPPRLTVGAHPYLPRARDWVMSNLEEEAKNGGGTSSQKKKARFQAGEEDMEGKKAIWVVQGLRGWVAIWGEEQLSNLCSLLLSLPPLPHLTPQIYSLLALLLSAPPTDISPKPTILQNLPTILDSLIASPPDQQSHLADIPTYLSAITSALIKMSFQDPTSLPVYLTKSFSLIFNTIMLAPSASPAILTAASEAIGGQGIVRYCISDEMIVSAVNYHRSGSDLPGARQKQKSTFLSKLLVSLVEAMDKHSLRIQYLLPILTAIISRLRLRVTDGKLAEVDPTGRGKTAAEELVLDLIGDIGDLRMARGFDHKEKVDEVVGMGIEVIGVEAILRVLPLNIEPDADGNTPQPGRAHLLPLIRSHTTNDSLEFFANYFRPLSERVFSRKVSAEDAGRGAEAKIWEVLVGQVWDTFPGFCEIPRDLKQGLSTPFMTLIANLLNTQPILLPALLKGLAAIVSSTRTLLVSTTSPEELRKQFGVDQEMARENMEYLKTMAKDTTSVMLNVFSQLPREQRGMVSDVIGLWTGIMTEQDIMATFTTVTTHLSGNLSMSAPVAPGSSPISHTMLDLLIIFVPHLPIAQAKALFNAIAAPTFLEHDDATVQKKSYRLLKRLIEDGKVSELVQGEKIEGFVKAVGECAAGVGPGAQRDRLQLISTVVQNLPKDRLHLIPELLSEAVLGTKEVNEKARDAGFDLLVVMGQKMAQGGEVRREAGDDEEDQGMSSAAASVEEYITMVAAGLTGTTPHMISASINALSRLLFEFKDDVSDSLITELVSTITVFLTMKNREIIKSALGFIKVATVALPRSTVEPHLPVLVPALLGWVHDHKNHFKSKTVHIFERMMRKFGAELILQNAPVGGERKVLEGIKKRKEKAKRKKAAGDREDGDEDEGKPKNSSGSAFDDILYNSDTDDELDEEDGQVPRGKNGKPIQGKKERKAAGTAYIRNEGDQPIDLLSRSIAGGISSVNPNAASRKRKPGQDASHFKTDATGKLIIEEEAMAGGGESGQGQGDTLAGSAFMSAQRGIDGQTRDAKGNLRFNKNNRQAREEEQTMMDDIDDGDRDSKKNVMERRKKRMEMGKLGGEFKAKRAGGDVKKAGGPDPYSYVPIGQAARGNNGTKGVKVSLTNKKKGSRR